MFTMTCQECLKHYEFNFMEVLLCGDNYLLITCPLCGARGMYRLDKFGRNNYGFGN